MSFTLLPALPSDAEALVRYCDYPAMRDNPLRLCMFPRSRTSLPEEERKWLADVLKKSLASPRMVFRKVCTKDGQPVGFAGWTIPYSTSESHVKSDGGGDKQGNRGEQRGHRNELPRSLDVETWMEVSKKRLEERRRVLRGREDIWRESPHQPSIASSELSWNSLTDFIG